ncbi:MAG: succinate dehydrogenase cytochrome b subunit [Elusimicrobiota bacterium]|jgi:succinate dehydrogenase / fumarate reductase cytochrome b subunit
MNGLLVVIRRYGTSSIGRKQIAALTGLMLVGFLCGHLAGNFLLYKGMEAFNHYSEFLQSQTLLPVIELGLLAVFLTHICMALWLTWENWRARPERYEVRESAGGRTWGSATMIWTGLFLLGFLLFHVSTFRLIEAEDEAGIFGVVVAWFQSVPVVVFYLCALTALGLHLSHGVQSAFQTFGAEHPNATPVIKPAGLAFAVFLAAAFGLMPLWSHCIYRG